MGYLEANQFNVVSKIIWRKFLNIRTYNDRMSPTPCTTVLSKENFKYDIIPFDSKIPQHFKLMAGESYLRTAFSHTTSKFELDNHLKVVCSILQLEDFLPGG